MIDAGVRELLDVIVRWVHVIAGILWIGNSMLWNWIDRNLEKPEAGSGTLGSIWLLHSGAFYRMEKTMLAGRGLPEPLHWFKWQAYTTWLSGAVLLLVVYYFTGGALLLGHDSAVSGGTAIMIGAGLVVIAWPLYDVVWRLPLLRNRLASGVLGMALILALAFALTRVFSGRAAFLHVGAILGTIMAGNVAMRIMPAQRQLVDAVAAGQGADPAVADRAKHRSIHNNYLTFPVIVLMVSGHFPGLYGQPYNWLLLGVLVAAGAGVRHFMNIRFTEPRWRLGLAATVVTAIAILYFAEEWRPGIQPAAAASHVSFADARSIIDRRCAACHSATPSDRTLGVMPGGVSFDTPEAIQAYAPRILQRAVRDRTMPPANKTSMTDAEREILRSWIESRGTKN
ncbi:MAG: urate hydroxylase PuuD [Gemmatimonadota bacterium]